MRFNLDPSLMDALIFAMENQQILHVLDSHTAKICPAQGIEADPADDRYLPIPQWQSADGFRLMEDFVAGLHQAQAREALNLALKSGRGVFRLFKDELKQYPEVERLWYRHKRREMRSRVVAWYNDFREYWGLEPLAWEEDENDTLELVQEDFQIRTLEPSDIPRARVWDMEFFREGLAKAADGLDAWLYGLLRREPENTLTAAPESWLGVYGPGTELVAMAWYRDHGTFLELLQLGVLQEYRGLGLGKALFDRVLDLAGKRSIMAAYPAATAFLAKRLEAGGHRLHWHNALWVRGD